jgi:glycosyltransferase involved in cell wall biosynthesis
MTIKISVIIPAYNEEKFLPETLQALSRQTFSREDFEIIVVDNASTDRTSALAKIHGADIIVQECQQGTNFARQAGLLASKGRIVAFLDADCIAPPEWLERIYHTLHSRKHPCVAIAGAYVFFSSMTDSLYIMQEVYRWIVMPALGSVMGRVFKRGGVIIGGNFAAFRKNMLKIGGFDTSYTFFGDDASMARRLGSLGYVHYDPRLYVMSSDRRFKREGLMKTNWEYAKNYFKVMMHQ